MAKDLSLFERQTREGTANLPRTNGFAELTQSFNHLASLASHYNTIISVEEAAKQGAEERLAGKTRDKLAPGATAATRAFNDAYREMDISIGLNQGQKLLNESLLEYGRPENLTRENNVANYELTSEGYIEGILENLLPEDRPKAALLLRKQVTDNSLRLQAKENEFRSTQERQVGAALIDEITTKLVDVSASGNLAAIEEVYQDLEDDIIAQQTLGYFGEDTANKYRKFAQQSILNGQAEHAYNLASLEPFGGERFIADVFQDKVESLKDITPTEKQGILQHLLSVQTHRKQALNAAEQVAQAQVDNAISSGQIKSVQDLRQHVVNLDAQGFPMSKLSLIQNETALINGLKAANKRAETNSEISQAALTKSNKIYEFSDSDLNNFYIDMVANRKELREQMMAQATNPFELEVANVPDWKIEAIIASSVPAPIPTFKKMLRDKLLEGALPEQLEAIRAYNYVSENNHKGLMGFDSRAKAFADVVSMRLDHTNQAPEIIIQEANNTILKADEDAYKKRASELTKFYNKNPNYISTLSTSIYNKNLGGPVNDEMWNAVKTEFDTNYQLVGNISDAADITIKNMKQSTGVSKFGPPGKPMQNPPENLDFYEFGHVVDNQVAELFETIAQQGQVFADQLPYTIKRSSKMTPFPANPTERELYENDYYKGKGWLNIDDKDRRVFLVSAGLNQSHAIDGPAYQLFYEDDNGYMRPLLMMMPQVDGLGNKSWVLSPGLMTFKSPDQYIPQYFKTLSEEAAIQQQEYEERKIDESATKQAELEFNKLTEKDFFFSERTLDFTKDIRKHEFVKENKPKQKEKLKAEKEKRVLKQLDELK